MAVTGEKLTSENRMVGRFSALRDLFRGHGAQDLVIGAVVLALTYAIAGYYTGGDQVGYGKAYLIVRGVDPIAGFNLYRTVISTIEVGHYCITYIASNLLMDKELFYSYTNAILSVLIMRLFRKMNVSIWIALLFIFSNFYVIVLYLSAERLKIAFIILLIALECKKFRWRKHALALIALSTHVTVILMFGRALQDHIKETIYKLISNKLSIKYILAAALAMFALWIAKDYIYWKAVQYIKLADHLSLISVLPIMACISLSILYSKERNRIFVDYIPIIIALIFLGGSRINMFAYLMFLWHALPNRNGVNAGIVGASAYMTYKSVNFIYTVLKTGQGF